MGLVHDERKAAAPAYPDTRWIQLFGDPVDPPIGNLVTVSYDYYLGCYLSGIFAAHVSQSNQIGYIGGISIPPLNADYNALTAGVHAVNPDATVTAAFAGSFQDPAKGYEIASQMFLDGIDYIQTDSAATDGGIIQEANEREGAMVSALDPAQYALGPASVLLRFVIRPRADGARDRRHGLGRPGPLRQPRGRHRALRRAAPRRCPRPLRRAFHLRADDALRRLGHVGAAAAHALRAQARCRRRASAGGAQRDVVHRASAATQAVALVRNLSYTRCLQ